MKELSFSQQRLLEAITNGRIYQTRQLLEAGTPAEFLDEEGYSPFLRACFIDDERHRTRTNLIKLLIVYGADVNTTDPQGRHALTYACMTENQEIVQLLLDISIHNIDLNKKDCNGDTPLMHAVRLGNVNLVTMLVDAMKKFSINMDVRNNADRTPYLEAKHLGRKECAELLLEKASASREVQVNPFLDFIEGEDERYRYSGDVRGVDWKRKKMKGAIEEKNRYNLIHQHQGKPARLNSKREIKIDSSVKRLPKRQGTKPRGLKNRNSENTTGFEEKKLASNATTITCVTEVLREVQVCNEKNDTETDDRAELIAARVTNGNTITTGNMEKEGLISVSETPVPRVRPSTAVITRREMKAARNKENRDPLLYNTFLTDGTPVRPSGHRVWVPHHLRSKTAPSRRYHHSIRQSSKPLMSDNPSVKRYSVDDNDQNSWYSHFSIRTSPSANFMNKIMAMYAEQVAPQSSYRKGVKPRKSEYAPTIVAPPDGEHDKHSDGRRSSSGSIRSLSGSIRNRKFSVITKTVASYISSRKAMTSGGKIKN